MNLEEPDRVIRLSDAQLATLHERGHVSVRDAVGPSAVAEMKASVWEFLRSRGVIENEPAGWPATIGKLQPLRKQGAFDAFLSPVIDTICDQLLGAGNWNDFGVGPQALLSLPTPPPWVLPHQTWHFDLPARGPTDTFGAVRFLGFVADVEPYGGGTVVVEGSHHLVRRMVEASPDADAGSSAQVRRRLAKLPFFAAVGAPDETRRVDVMDEGNTADGVPVRVVELTGRAGDITIMHPWLIHNISMNCSDRPRMMMSYTRYASDRS